jgi:hypothetical protein
MSGSPGGRGKFCDAPQWRVCKAWADVGEVITDRDVEPAAAFNNGEEIAAMRGPACSLPIWIQLERPRAMGRIEFSARSVSENSPI